MDRRATFLIVVAAMLTASSPARSHQVVISSDAPLVRENPTLPKGTGLVMGRTIDPANGRPVPGVTVMLRTAPNLTDAVLTDDQGRFVFRDLPRGRFTFWASKLGYVSGKYGKHLPDTGLDVNNDVQTLELGDDGRAGDLVIAMWKYAAIGGTALDEHGDPIVGISVRALRATFSGGRRWFSLENSPAGRTDDRGVYRIASLIPGDYLVALPVVTSSWPKSLQRLLAAPGAQPPPGFVDSTMYGQTWIAGNSAGDSRTTLEGNNAGFAIAVSDRSPAIAGLSSDGRLLSYETQFYPGASTMSRASTVTLGSGEERSGVDFHLRPVRTVTVSGTLLGPNGPAPNMLLRLVDTDTGALSTDPEVNQTLGDADGTFSFLGVVPGDYSIKVLLAPRPKNPPLPSRSTTVETGSGGSRGVIMGGDIRGSTLPTEPTLFADTRVSVGDQDVRDVAVTLRTGLRIMGRVQFDSAAERPAPQYTSSLYIERVDGTRSVNLSLLLAPVDSQGNLMSYGEPPGKYFVRVPWDIPGWYFRGSMLGTRDLSVTPLELSDVDVSGIVVRFSDKPAAELSGTVRSDRGPAEAGAGVILFPVNRDTWGAMGVNPPNFRSVAVVSGGRYRVDRLPPGEYFVAAVPEARIDWCEPKNLDALARSAVRLTIADGESRAQDLSLPRRMPDPDDAPPGPHGPWVSDDQDPAPARDARPAAPVGTGVIAGVVVSGETKEPLRRVQVTLTGAALVGGRLVITDDTGRFSFAGVPAGRFTLTAARPAYLTVTYGASRPGRPGTPITLADGQRVTDITLALLRGSVITGVVTDERGQPMNGASIRLLQYRTVNSERRLEGVTGSNPLGETTDDRGTFRAYGLAAGAYVVAAYVRFGTDAARPVTTEDVQYAVKTLASSGAASKAAAPSRPGVPPAETSPTSSMSYAPVYFPGTSDPAQATTIEVGPGEERAGIDFAFRPVRAATVKGTIVNPAGPLPAGVDVRLLNISRPSGLDPFDIRAIIPARAWADGAFSFAGVGPGQYTVVATTAPASGRSASAASAMLWATADLPVNGTDVTNFVLTLQPGMTVSGTMAFDATTLPAPVLATVRASLAPILSGSQVSVGQLTAPVDAAGAFSLTGVMPGRYNVRPGLPTGATGWLVRSARVGGRDVMDEGFEVRPGEDVTGLSITFTDRAAEISGTLRDPSGRPAPDYFIIVFPVEKALWRAGARRIQQVRPGTDGKFLVKNLVAGDYRIAALTDVAANEWFDPEFLAQLVSSTGTVTVTLAEGEKKVQDIRIAK